MDEAANLLIDAMWLMELAFGDRCKEGTGAEPSDLLWTAHGLVQRAFGLCSGSAEPYQLNRDALLVLSKQHARVAIADASERLK